MAFAFCISKSLPTLRYHYIKMIDDLLIACFLPALAVESWELDEVDKHECSSLAGLYTQEAGIIAFQ